MGTVRVAELVATLSYAADLGLGQPLAHCMRQTVVALRLADLAGAGERDREATFYLGLSGGHGRSRRSHGLITITLHRERSAAEDAVAVRREGSDDVAVTTYRELLARIAERAREDDPMTPLGDLPAALGAGGIDRAEQRLGFALHPLLAVVYRDFANGGFGPEYQLLSLLDGPTSEQAVDLYLARRSENAGTAWAWPEGVLPILSWGCAMYACVDCRSEHGTVLLFEPNPGDPDLAWYVDVPDLETWFVSYVTRTGWWDKLEDGDEPDMQPWPSFRDRAAG